MKKNVWIDPVISDDLIEIFINYGNKTLISKSTVLTQPHKRNSLFYYVESGLLAVTLSTGILNGSMIIKLIPENRAYGFTDYSTAGLDRHSLMAIRNSVVYTLPYSVMDTLINNKTIDIRSFRRYTYLCRQATANTLSAMIALPYNKKNQEPYTMTVMNEFNHLKYKDKFQELTLEDIQCLMDNHNDYDNILKKEREYFIKVKHVIEH